MAIEEPAAPGVPEWVVTFGDMMSLLLTFFIMLVSMSELKEEEKYQAMVDSMRRQFGPEAANAALIPGEIRPRNSEMSQIATTGRAKRKDIMNGGQKVEAPVGENQRVRDLRLGQSSSVGGIVQFEGFETTLSPAAKLGLDEIAAEIKGKRHLIEVRGHTLTQPVPKDLGFVDNYDLGFQRARVVQDYLVEKGVTRDRMQLTSFGNIDPLYRGHNPDDLKKNARVQVFMWDKNVRSGGSTGSE